LIDLDFFTTEGTEHTEFSWVLKRERSDSPDGPRELRRNPSSETGRRFLFSVSSLPSVVIKSGFELDFEHTIFVVKKIRIGNRRPAPP